MQAYAPAERLTLGERRPSSKDMSATFLLGHRDATVTRVVYIREIADARRRHMRRSRMTAEFGGALRVALGDDR